MRELRDAIAERDETRRAWDRLRGEVDELKAQLAARPAPAANASEPKAPAPKKKPPEALLNVPPVEPGTAETALLA